MTAFPLRRAGLLVPLFSCPSADSWGIGDIGDVKAMTAWLSSAGLRILQLLPLNEMAPGQQSPYSAMSAMAIDPIYIRVPEVPEFAAGGGERALDAAAADRLERVRSAPAVDYESVRSLKLDALACAFQEFLDAEWRHHTARAREFKLYQAAESWWLDDYSLFRAVHEREGYRSWTEWPEGLRDRDPGMMDATRRSLERDVLFRQYLQWIADLQWRQARAEAAAAGVSLFGDLAFMVDRDSADVWANQSQFRLDASVGVPPDAFSETGQDWGMPPYHWSAIADAGFRWLRDRARRTAALYDGYRIDHLVGFYRTYSKPLAGGEAAFEPAEEDEQRSLGEQVLGIFGESGSELVAEDLGVVPDFVRESLARLNIPGCRVFRWERHWHTDGQPYRDPSEYPEMSVAVSGTHDTEPQRVWWEELTEEERRAVAAMPTVQQIAGTVDLAAAPYDPTVRDVLLEALFASRSAIVLLPIQDLFGWRDRINEPATVTPHNWSFRLPWPIDRIDDQDEARERRETVQSWVARYDRGQTGVR